MSPRAAHCSRPIPSITSASFRHGNLRCGAADGVQCIAPDGTKLGLLKVPHPVGNLTFGGRNRCRLSICASHSPFAIYTNQRGAECP